MTGRYLIGSRPAAALDRVQAPSSASFYGPVVVLSGRNLIDVANLVGRGVRDAEKRDGIPPSTRLAELLAMLAHG